MALSVLAIILSVFADATPSTTTSQLVCRTTSSEGTMELSLAWDGSEAKGSLAQTGPSGNVTSQRVRAERFKTMIVVDELNQQDLVTHAAVVAEKEGKRYMRVGDDGKPWRACE
jgi:hypothetical protein